MIKLKLRGDVVVSIENNIDPDYTPKENEVLLEKLPQINLSDNEKAYIYYRDGEVQYEKVLKESK